MLSNIDPKDLWALSRHSMFSASENYKLLATGAGGKGWGSLAWTYIRKKARESMTVLQEQPKLEYVEALLHGNAHEAPAFAHYVKVTGNTVMEYHGSNNPIYIPYNKFSGGSPDGVARSEGQIFWGLEVKCPQNSDIHMANLDFKDQWDLKQARIHDYTQCQMLLMASKANGWHWMSYDDRWINPKLKGKIIEVLPDEKFQVNLDIKLKLAQKERLRIIEQYSK